MPRRERKQSGTGIYHVMLRGINRQDFFEEAEDYWSFIRILSAVQESHVRITGSVQVITFQCKYLVVWDKINNFANRNESITK